MEPAPTADAAASPRTTRSRILRWSLGILIALGAVAFIVYKSFTFLSQPPPRRGRFADAGGPQSVGVATIQRGDIRVMLNALGAVTPITTVTVQTQISGVLMKVGFTEGQLVRKGQFLAQIDPRPYQVALEQDQAQLARDEAALRQAQMDLERYNVLLQQQSIARQTAEDQVWIVKQEEGTVAYDKAQIKAQQLNLVYCHITAPSDGRVGLRLVDPGNYVQAGSTTGLVVLTLLNPISVIFSVPEDSLPQIQAQLHAGAKLQATAFDRANVTRLAVGTFAALDNEVNTTTGSVNLRADFDNAAERLFPSQFVNVTLLLETRKDVVTVPVAAVQRGAPGTYVYLVDAENTVSVHPISLGPQDGNFIAVVSGLSPGDRVVTDGADRLRDGAHVNIPAPGSPPAAGAPGAAELPGGRHRHGGRGDGGGARGDGSSSGGGAERGGNWRWSGGSGGAEAAGGSDADAAARRERWRQRHEQPDAQSAPSGQGPGSTSPTAPAPSGQGPGPTSQTAPAPSSQGPGPTSQTAPGSTTDGRSAAAVSRS
jgi:multidrug efflux system membrane fusion protein